jgi:hypothetical protein
MYYTLQLRQKNYLGTSASSTTKIDFQLQNYLPTCSLMIRPLLQNIGGYHYLKIKYYDFLQLFLHHGIFLPAILSAVVFFRNSTAGGKMPCLKIDRD